MSYMSSKICPQLDQVFVPMSSMYISICFFPSVLLLGLKGCLWERHWDCGSCVFDPRTANSRPNRPVLSATERRRNLANSELSVLLVQEQDWEGANLLQVCILLGSSWHWPLYPELLYLIDRIASVAQLVPALSCGPKSLTYRSECRANQRVSSHPFVNISTSTDRPLRRVKVVQLHLCLGKSSTSRASEEISILSSVRHHDTPCLPLTAQTSKGWQIVPFLWDGQPSNILKGVLPVISLSHTIWQYRGKYCLLHPGMYLELRNNLCSRISGIRERCSSQVQARVDKQWTWKDSEEILGFSVNDRA